MAEEVVPVLRVTFGRIAAYIRSRALLKGIAVLALLFAIVVFLWFVPELQGKYFSPNVQPEDVPALVNEYRRTWAQIVAGFGLLLGLYFTWRRVEISQEQQVTERFTRAIEQLGASDDKEGKPKLEIRLGGIYALERIAKDSPRRDYATIMEILTTYVRQNAPWSSKAATLSEATEQAGEDSEQMVRPSSKRGRPLSKNRCQARQNLPLTSKRS